MFSLNFGFYKKIKSHLSSELKIYLNFYVNPKYQLFLINDYIYIHSLRIDRNNLPEIIPFPMISYTINFGLGNK